MSPTDLPTESQGKSVGAVDTIDEKKFCDFIQKARSGLSDVIKCYHNSGLYISRMNVVSLEEYTTYRSEYCKRYHKKQCSECTSLTKMASHIAQEGIVKVSEVYRRQFPDGNYQSDKAVRRLMQLPCVIFKVEYLYVMELRPELNYRTLIDWIGKTMPGKGNIERKLEKETLKSLCELASNESDRKLIQAAATWGMTGKQARNIYGIEEYSCKVRGVKEAIANVQEIRNEIMKLAKLKETALLRTLGVEDDSESDSESSGHGSDLESVIESDSDEEPNCNSESESSVSSVQQKNQYTDESQSHSPTTTGIRYDPDFLSKDVPATATANPAPSNDTLLLWLRENKLNWFSFYEEVAQYLKNYNSEVLNQVLLDFTDYLSDSDLSDEEERLVEVSRQAFLEFNRRKPLLIEGEEVLSESDNEVQGPERVEEVTSLLSEEGKKQIRSARIALRKKAKREAAKTIASTCILKRKLPKRTSRIIKEHPSIGKDIEDFVMSKKVGADAWRRTGVLTFDGVRTRGKKVTYRNIQEHLQEKYDCKIGYGTVVQLCVIRSKRRISARRYKGVAKVTCRKSRKGFAVKLNPDAHWSSALYKGLDSLQLKDGRDKVLLNRDDQAGFRLDTTFTHRQGKCITMENAPALTTRTDFVNSYSSLLQTTSYLFMESDTTEKACVGLVKPHFMFQKNPTQHFIDLEMLESKLPSHLGNRYIECVRVDGATDEGPGHVEVQFLWTERHIEKRRICTIVTSRHSGGSYLNEVELMNGCIAKAHSNLYIPSTLTGNNYDSNGLNSGKLRENLDIATDVYIDRVNGSACRGTTLQLYKGGQNEAITERRQSLLVFLKGKAKERMQLKESNPELFKYFENVWKVHENHMNKDLPENYMFMLNLCFKPECPHPLCVDKSVGRDAAWYEHGPLVSYIPVPMVDPKRPWGGKCQECTTFCTGHYMSPEEHQEFVREHGATELMYKPPSIVIRDQFYESMRAGRSVSDNELEEVARKTLLSVEELKMHVEHLRITAERRKEGAKKAALTRKSKSTTTRKANKKKKAESN